jgi:2'-5' RNA ligase
LGRVEAGADAEHLATVLRQQEAWTGGETVVREMLIMGSELRPQGPIYTVLGRAQLPVQ